jgi:uncharacterized membrane protein YgcG
MHCPACRQRITETEATCLQCGFSLEALTAQMGIQPQLSPPVADLARVLSSHGRRSLINSIQFLEQRFPEVSATIVIAEVPQGLKPEVYAFWLFNRANLFSAVERGGDNHGLLLLIDPQTSLALATIGYGLEPFISELTLEKCLRPAVPYLAKKKFAEAGVSFFREAERQFTEQAQQMPEVFGYTESLHWLDSTTGELTHSAQDEHEDPY